MNEVKAPRSWGRDVRPLVFLAGSIEMGAAAPWQGQVVHELRDLPGTVLNPRRDDWDASWVQSIEHDQFRGQVEWELQGLEECDVALVVFDPLTKSPVTLMELGLFHQKAMVCCPAGFWRRGNVEIVCRRYHVPFFEALPDFLAAAKARIDEVRSVVVKAAQEGELCL